MGQANVNRSAQTIQQMIAEKTEAQVRIRVTALQNAIEVFTTSVSKRPELREDVYVTANREIPELYEFFNQMWNKALLGPVVEEKKELVVAEASA